MARPRRRSEEVRERGEPRPLHASGQKRARKCQRVEHGSGQPSPGHPVQIAVEERAVEPRVVRDEHRLPREGHEAADSRGGGGRSPQVRLADAGQRGDLGGKLGARVDERLERAGLLETADPDGADLTDTRAAAEPGRLEVEDDIVGVLQQRIDLGARKPDRRTDPAHPGIAGDEVVEERAREPLRDGAEGKERARRVRGRHRRPSLLEQLHEPVGGVEGELHASDDRRTCVRLQLCSRRGADEVPARRGGAAKALVQRPRRHAEPAPAGAASRHGRADRAGRSGAALPHGAHPAGGERGAGGRDPGGSPRHLPALAAHAAVSRAPSGAGRGDALADLLQVRGGQPAGQPQAEHGRRAGLLQQEGGADAAFDRDRRGPVGERARVRLPADRPRVQGLHGQDLVRPEAVPPLADRGLGREDRPEPVRGHAVGSRRPRGASGLARQPRHRDLGGRRGRGRARGHRVLPRQRPQPRAHAPDRDRPGGDSANGARRRLSGRRHRLRRRRLELRRPRLSVPAREDRGT